MQVNTKTGQCKLTKREQQTLADCKALLLQIAKHGSGQLCNRAEEGAEDLGAVQACLNPLVLADGEVLSTGY